MKIILQTGNDAEVMGFRHFWAKKVNRFDVEQHCARCLIGPYQKGFGVKMAVNTPLIIASQPGDLFYFCGVAKPAAMHKNFHLAVEHDAAVLTEKMTYNGYTLRVQGGRELPILPNLAQRLDVTDKHKTCRNFQFGVQYLLHRATSSSGG